MKFHEFKLNEHILEAISYMGFDEATPIQKQAIPEIIDGNDLIACAQNGTGKTAAFVLPILDKLSQEEETSVSTLISSPKPANHL